MNLQKLPISAALPQILETLLNHSSLVLEATPGSGKTTRVPPSLLSITDKEVWVLEPRRVAAKWAAHRVADELGERVGTTVGYHFRLETVAGPKTRLRFMTEGTMLRKMMGNPLLAEVGIVVLDEFHERNISSDVVLAYLFQLQKQQRPDLKIVVMSATLESERLTSYLTGVAEIKVPGRLHPIEFEYHPAHKFLDQAVAHAVEQTDGKGILVFLPGMAEIRRAETALSDWSHRTRVPVYALHGDISREAQDRAITDNAPKVVLATNIAETSLTIAGIDTVIDSGLFRQASFSHWSGMPALRTKQISKSSAIQRAGRAGRLGPGRCVRLYSKAEYEGRTTYEVPEIGRVDISEILLQLKVLGIQDLATFSWFEAPSQQMLEASCRLLFQLGALDQDCPSAKLTPLGKRMSAISAHPRIARLLLEALKLGIVDDASGLAALISEGEIEGLDLLQDYFRSRGSFSEKLRRAKSQLLHSLGISTEATPRKRTADHPDEALAKCILAGFPDRVAKKRNLSTQNVRAKSGRVELVFCSGDSASVEETALIAAHEYFLVTEVQEMQFQMGKKTELIVRNLCPLEADWLMDDPGGLLKEQDTVTWNSDKECVTLSQGIYYGTLPLDVSTVLPNETQMKQVTDCFLRSFLKKTLIQLEQQNLADWAQLIGGPEAAGGVEEVFARLRLLTEAGVTEAAKWLDSKMLTEWFLQQLKGISRAKDYRDLSWPEVLIDATSLRHQLEKLCPTHIQLPRGRRVKINYSLSTPPWAESRMQDFFGMKVGPKLCNGQVAVVLHLLAPNHRAVQVTQDLAGFWVRGYHEVRGQLQRRYPRHAWPEDPNI